MVPEHAYLRLGVICFLRHQLKQPLRNDLSHEIIPFVREMQAIIPDPLPPFLGH